MVSARGSKALSEGTGRPRPGPPDLPDCIRAVRIARVALLCAAVVAVGVVLVSGGEDGGPQTPAALPGLPPPFLGTAVAGDGGLTAAVDAYGDVVDLRPGPAGEALIDN